MHMLLDEQGRQTSRIVGTLKDLPKEIEVEMVEHFTKADPACGAGDAKGLGLERKRFHTYGSEHTLAVKTSR